MKSMNILVIEEDAQDYLAIRELFDAQNNQFAVEWSPTCENALKLTKHTYYDLCLVGYMPSQSHHFFAWLYEESNLPIILLVKPEHIVDKHLLNRYQCFYLYKHVLNWQVLECAMHYASRLLILLQDERKFRTIFNHTHVFIGLVDTEGMLVEINCAALHSINMQQHAVIGMPVWETPWVNSSPKVQNQFKSSIEAAIKGETVHSEIEVQTKSNQVLTLDIALTPIRDNLGNVLWVLAEGYDLSAQKEIEQRLHHATLYDQLTGLPNRHLFIEQLDQAMQRVKQDSDYHIAVLFLDLDRFKVINASLGHDMGDWLIMEIAQRLQTCVQEPNVLARSSGDEFMILLNNLEDFTDATRLASDILDTLAQPFSLDGHDIVTSASIGIAYSLNDRDSTDLLRDADTAMYKAKSKGKGCYAVFKNHMHTQAISRFQIESDLHRALEKNHLVLFYQPQTDLETERLVGTEALIRFCHPQKGLLSPNEFIPILEDTGNISSIGEWILHTACQQLKTWLDTGLAIERISVNVSAHQFRNKRLVNYVAEAIHTSGLAPHYLELELTESILLENTRTAIKTLSRFKEMGIRVTIDDFGTGYASLSYLKRFPADCLKIDKSFIDGVVSAPEDAAITVATIDMAHALGLAVIAEGVETIAQRDFLRDHGCDLAQGYLYSPPMDEKAFFAWARQYNKITEHRNYSVPSK